MALLDHNTSLDSSINNLAAYREKPIFRKRFGPIIDDLNAIERVTYTLLLWSEVSSSSGVLLERIGSLVDLENYNNELPDHVFRAFVQAALLARLTASQLFDVDLQIRDVEARRKGVLTIAKKMQTRAFSDETSIYHTFPFTWIVIIPGLVGIEKQLARTVLIRSIGATDRLIGITFPEGQNNFPWNGLLEEGWNSGFWATEF